jgi:D-alanine-D-alanine ligase
VLLEYLQICDWCSGGLPWITRGKDLLLGNLQDRWLVERENKEMEVVLVKSYTDKPWRSPETYRLIEDSLRERWKVTSISTKSPEALGHFLSMRRSQETRDLFVFNLAEYLDEENRRGFLPALLEGWNVPHLGSRAKTVAIGLNKARTKVLLDKHRIPTPRYFVAHDGTGHERAAKRIGYPLIVKPIMEGGHIGIREDSVVYGPARLHETINRIFDEHNQPALVEEYITGDGLREFSVGVIDEEVQLFTPVEIDYDAMDVEEKILTYEAAQKDLERIKPVSDRETRDRIIDLSRRTFAAVGAHDYSRVDLRMNDRGCYVLEINIMPGLGPYSFLPEAARDIYGLEYNQLIQKLAENSMMRQESGI